MSKIRCQKSDGAEHITPVADITALVAIDFMKPAKLACRPNTLTSQSGMWRSPRGPAPVREFRRECSDGAVELWIS
jgi:hypothetical protein